MRTFIIIAAVIIVLILGKIFIFKKPESKDGPGGGAASGMGGGKSKDGKGGPGGAGGPVMQVNIYVTKPETIDNIVYASGSISPNEEVELKAEASGRLVTLNVNEGSYVAKGQLIAKIKDTDLQAQLKKLEYEENLAKQIEARQKKLLEINAISKEEYEISANRINTLSADKDVIKAQLEKTLLYAPFAGKIGFKSVSIGAYVTPATTIATLVQMNPVKVDFTIPEKYSPQIKIGKGFKFEVDGQQGVFNASISAIDPKIDPNLRTLRVRGISQNPSGKLMPGMFVRVTADLDTESSIMIPTESIVPVLKGKKVYVMRDGKATEVMVTTGLRTQKKVQVIGGLQPGDSLIVSGIMALKADMAVKAKQVVN
ncbi:MAG: efflux RND transporter periplasmic adaptor subunit [Spirosomataceae bacterium]